MKVLLAHTPYEQRGGEDVHVEHLALQYKALGIAVKWLPESRLPPHLSAWGALPSLNANSSAFDSLKPGKDFDFVHLHNAFPALGISFFHWLKKNKIPSLFTVHNHRFYCTNGLALRDQKICKDCRSNTIPWKALLHNCNQDWKKTAYHTLAIGQLHRNQLLQSSIHRFIAPSPYVKAELQAWGLEAEKITTLIHPIAPHLEPSENTPENKMEKIDIFYAGRLSPEKGIEEIIQMAMQAPDLQFAIAGNGPLLARVQYMKRKIRNLKLFSDLPRAQMITLLSRSRLAIAPSLCNETLSQFALEAMCLGKPVVVGNAESTHWLTQNPFFAFSADPQNISAFLQTARQALNSSVNQEKVQALRIQLGNERYQNELKNIVKDLLGQ